MRRFFHLGAVLSLLSTPAVAATIDFDDLALPGQGFALYGSSRIIDGFRFSIVNGSGGGHVISWRTGSSQFQRTGSGSLSASNSADILVTRVGGGVFSARSADVDAIFQTLPFEFDADNGSLIQTFAPDTAPGNQSVTLNGFDGITSLRISALGIAGLANLGNIDNLDLVALEPVPLPTTVTLLGAGLLGLRGIRRRRG